MMISSFMQRGVVQARMLAYEVEENGHQQVDGVEGVNGMLFFYGVMIGFRYPRWPVWARDRRRREQSRGLLVLEKNDSDSGKTRGHESFFGLFGCLLGRGRPDLIADTAA